MFGKNRQQNTTTLERLEVFKDGTFLPMDGGFVSFSAADVSAVAANYDPKVFEAPVVVGHPQSNHPAYGWVSSLEVEDGKLLANAQQVEPQFSEMVEVGRFKKISICLFSPKTPSNPKPGSYYLKHVGFLGAAAPAVPGLKPVSLSGDESGTITLAADLNFSEGEDLDAMARISELEAQLASRDALSSVEEMIDEGRILPRDKEGVIAFMENLSGADEFSFSEGGEIVKRPGVEWFQSYVRNTPQLVNFSEISGDAADPYQGDHASQLEIPKGYSADLGRMELHKEALRFAQANNCEYMDAVLAVSGKR